MTGNQFKYASITGPFPLTRRKEGKVTQIITTQTMPLDNYSRDINVSVTHDHLQILQQEGNQSRE